LTPPSRIVSPSITQFGRLAPAQSVKPSPPPASHFDTGTPGPPGPFAASAASIKRTAGARATAARRRHRAGLAREELRSLSVLANGVRSPNRERASKTMPNIVIKTLKDADRK
jgi:hypothetical protein